MKKIKTKLISLLLAFTMVAVLLPTLFATPVFAAYQTRCNVYANWQGTNSWQSSGYWYLTDNYTISKSGTNNVAVNGTLYLDLNGYTITFKGSSSYSAIDVKNGGKLYLYDSSNGNGKIKRYTNGSIPQHYYDSCIFLDNSTLYMYGGNITGFDKASTGGGVHLYNNSVFEMRGGTISDNKAKNVGGGVQIESGSFYMYDGTISGCSATNGGGVNVHDGQRFYMYGGKITGCSATLGGGVSCGGGSQFNMQTGSIRENNATNGGGVFSYGTVNMYSGTMYSNKASGDGGGVQLEGGTINMSGGDIYSNTAGLSGGGIGCHSGTVNVSGGLIDYNYAKDDGGGGIGGWDNATIKISGSAHIYENRATSNSGHGGAVMGRRGTTVTFNGGRIGSGNSAPYGSGVYSDVTPTYNSGRFYTASVYTSSIPTNKYSTITFNQNSGNNGTSSISYQYWNSNLPNITIPTRAGYTFNGYKNSNGEWYYNADGTPYNKSGDGIKWDYIGAQTLTAQWTPITYTIAYDTNGGEGTINSTAATYDANATLAAAPTRTGYTFNGWNTVADGTGTTYQAGASVSNLTSTNGATVTLYAQWTPNTYTVTLDNQSATTEGNTSVTATYDASMPTATMPTKTGYTFGGYFDAQTDGTQYYNADGTSAKAWDKAEVTTLYAQWTPNSYSITYKDNGGADFSGENETDAPTQHTYGTDTVLKDATKRGYTFGGWYATTDCSGSSVTTLGATAYTEDITLYAQWTEHTATLTYDANGHGTAPDAVTMNYTAATNAAAALSEKGFVFNGWNTKADGTGTAYAAGAVVKAENVDPEETV